jgi:hypothetical protein
MARIQKENTELLSLTLKTPESAADAAAVASMLRALVVLIEEARSELKVQGEFMVRVNPFKEGSLEIPVQIFVVGAAASLFTFNPDLAKILDTLKSIFELKKYFKGQPPSEKSLQDSANVGNIIIKDSQNVVINIIQHRRVDEALDQAGQDLEKDKSLTGMKLVNESSGEEIANIAREDFKYLRTPGNGQETEDVPQDRIRTVEALLTIHSPVLQGTAKWKFLYEGKQVSISIKDERFLEKVSNGVEAFRNGDRLKVELEIGEKYVASIQDYERTNQYSILTVLEHIPRPVQPKLPMLSQQSEPH